MRRLRGAKGDGARAPNRDGWFWVLFEPLPKHPRRVSKPLAVVILVLNTVPFPGLGTIIYGKWERGVVQFLLTFLIVGWLWAILDALLIVRRAWEPPEPPAWQTAAHAPTTSETLRSSRPPAPAGDPTHPAGPGSRRAGPAARPEERPPSSDPIPTRDREPGRSGGTTWRPRER